ncbi:hypothetical protein L0P54_08450 [Anaerosalibacter bizertensis]|uniref:Uncharacterized protein n=1 Tax=Anaerosalibacter bizertensis TaxID=932217 RepID=A0A9Q4ADS5_9FIRM|nr:MULTISPECIES: hypothetical protein [Bacillota]MBV1819274.1 hypothetical protein [Bacteroidales bacterium MSK.15.36]MCB5559808.1 hypothetical protein [Anaerosalibacter bizertensis]MCG4565786.1 hypothetical protein [Anaerosalibacter bizertensis]MCG4581169.1 hypothetical protein [Clostridium cochlearium]MCG4583018.1 hypothetical protein [Anaerosalibacter bizertensis]
MNNAIDTENDRLSDLLELNLVDCTSPEEKETGDRYIREFDTSLAYEIACDFYQTDNIEILSSGLDKMVMEYYQYYY